MTHEENALAAVRYEPPHPAENPDRVAFMHALDRHEDLHFEAGLDYGSGPSVGEESPYAERLRMSRREVVAAFDHACLTVKG